MPVVTGHPRVEVDQQKLNGVPVVAGTRVPVSSILVELASGTAVPEISDQYGVTPEDVKACVLYAAWAVERGSAEAA